MSTPSNTHRVTSERPYAVLSSIIKPPPSSAMGSEKTTINGSIHSGNAGHHTHTAAQKAQLPTVSHPPRVGSLKKGLMRLMAAVPDRTPLWGSVGSGAEVG